VNIILILICFSFPGGPGDECGITSVETTHNNTRTLDENVNVFCTAAFRALADKYPGAVLTTCKLWDGKPIGGEST